jgi:hypothetical protein
VRPFLRRVAVAVACVMAFGVSNSLAQPGEAYAGPVRVVGLPTIPIDPSTSSGFALLELKNVGPNRVAGLLLAGGDFVGDVTRQKLGAHLSFAAADESSGKLTRVIDLDPGQRLALRVIADGVWDAGTSRAPLFIDGLEFEHVTAQRNRVPLNVKLAAAGSAEAPLAVALGQACALGLENGDELNYPLSWELFLDGRAVPSTATPLLLPASGSKGFEVLLPADRFPGWIIGLFKENKPRGLLNVTYQKEGSASGAMTRSFPIFLALGYWSPDERAWLGGLVCLVLLALGGLASLFLTHAIPNGFRRLKLQQQLAVLDDRISKLSDFITASHRVALRVACLGLLQRINSEQTFFPGAADVFDLAEREASTLELRVAHIAHIDGLLQQIALQGSDGPPDLLHEQAKRLQHACRSLQVAKPTSQMLDSVALTVQEVDKALVNIQAEDQGLREQAVEGATKFWAECFKPAWDGLNGGDPTEVALKEEMGPFVQHVEDCLGNNKRHKAETLASIDTALAKLGLILAYLRVVRSATDAQAGLFNEIGASDEARASQPPAAAAQGPGIQGPLTQRQRFFACLSGSGARALAQARLVLRQAEQGIFVKQLEEQLRQSKFRVQIDPEPIFTNDPATFRLVFNEDKFNDAAAREKLRCVWTFREEAKSATSAEAKAPPASADEMCDCWLATRFFETPGRRSASVQVYRGAVAIIPEPSKNQRVDGPSRVLFGVCRVRRKWIRQRTQLELTQLAVALGVTMLSLVAGARDQIEKLDLAAGLVAVFALGFGADVMKNIVARRPPGNDAART